LEGKFSRQTYWGLIYVDAQGEVQVTAISNAETDSFRFPTPGHGPEKNVDDLPKIPFSDKEEPGVHCLFVIAGSQVIDEATLVDRLKMIGRPPQDLNGRWAFKTRDFGQPNDARSPQEIFAHKLKQRLPGGIQPVYALFLRTRLP
jgi:hypothetical protein